MLVQEGKAYHEQTGVGPLPVVLYNGMPLQREQLDPDELETTVMHKILDTTSFFQRVVYLVRKTSTSTSTLTTLFVYCYHIQRCFLCFFFPQGELASDHDIVDYIMNQPNVVPRINPRILTTTRSYLDLSSTSQFAFIRFLKLI